MGKLSSSFKCSNSDFELTITYPEHPINQLNWQGYFKKQFKAIGTFIETHDIRISMHPGQFTLINLVNTEVFEHPIGTHMLSGIMLQQTQVKRVTEIIPLVEKTLNTSHPHTRWGQDSLP
jgi:hypothetical protein